MKSPWSKLAIPPITLCRGGNREYWLRMIAPHHSEAGGDVDLFLVGNHKLSMVPNIVSCCQDWTYVSACCWTAATAQYAGARVRLQYTVYGQVR